MQEQQSPLLIPGGSAVSNSEYAATTDLGFRITQFDASSVNSALNTQVLPYKFADQIKKTDDEIYIENIERQIKDNVGLLNLMKEVR